MCAYHGEVGRELSNLVHFGAMNTEALQKVETMFGVRPSVG
jgi:hypothetical protein